MSAERRRPLISGNWKMHLNHYEAIQTVQKLAFLVTKEDFAAVEVSIHPPFTDLRSVQTLIDGDRLFIPHDRSGRRRRLERPGLGGGARGGCLRVMRQ